MLPKYQSTENSGRKKGRKHKSSAAAKSSLTARKKTYTLTFQNVPWAWLIAMINSSLLTKAWTASQRGQGGSQEWGDATLMSF